MPGTRQELRDRARVRADQDASTFPTDAQYNILLDEAIRDVWYDLLAAGLPWRFRANPTTYSAQNGLLTLVPSSGNGLDGSEIAGVGGVYFLDGGSYRELRRLPEDRRASLKGQRGSPEFYEIQHSVLSMLIYLHPYPPDGGTYIVDVWEAPPTMSADNSAWKGPARTDELIVLRTAMKACRKEGNDQAANFLAQEYAELWPKVLSQVQFFNRNAATIRDVGPLRPARDPFDFDV